MIQAAIISGPLAAEFELRARRSRAVANVTAQLAAKRADAEAEAAAAATVVLALYDRFAQLRDLRDRLEAEHAEALKPTPEIVDAELAIASANELFRTVSVEDDEAATTAAKELAEFEDQLTSARQAQARNARPLTLRLSIAIEQTSGAERELKAAQDAMDAADRRVGQVLIALLRLQRDAALLAFDAANVDLAIAGGVQYPNRVQLTLGESGELLSELDGEVDHFFGGASSDYRAQAIGRVNPDRLLDRADVGA